MAFIGAKPTNVPLTANDITDGSISVAKLTSTLDLSSNTVTLPSGVGGKVLQVVQAVFSSQVAIASTSYTDTSLTASITPSSSSNKVLIFVSFEYTAYRDSNAGMTTDANIVRGSTQIYENHECLGSTLGTGATGYQQTFGVCNFNYLDSPSTTSATTYKVQAKNQETSGNRQLKVNNDGGNSRSTITLFEVSA